MIHPSEDDLLALLRGELSGERLDSIKAHLGACSTCARTLAKEAALDTVLWEAKHSSKRCTGCGALLASSAHAERCAACVRRRAPVPAPTSRPRRWFIAGTFAAAAATAMAYLGAGGAAVNVEPATPVSLFAWYNVVFLIPLIVGILLSLGSSVGGADGDAHVEHDVGHDVAHADGAGGLSKALSLLGVGRVPFTLLLVVASLIFGGIGIIANALFASFGLAPGLFGPLSLALAFVGTVISTGAVAKVIERVMPSVETYRVSKRDFEGCIGKLLLPADASSGYAQIKDPEGNVHNIKCRSLGGVPLAKGTEILVVEYEEETQTFIVDANPVITSPTAR